MFRLAFITDEVTQSFAHAVEFAKQYGLQGLELRTVDNTPIDQISAETLKQWKQTLDDAGLCVPSLASSFFKCELSADCIDAEMEKLQRLCDAADILGCPFIRGFSFLARADVPFDAAALAPYFQQAADLLQRRGKTLLLEADPGVNTCNHARLAQLLQQVDRPEIGAIFDPGNSLYDPLGEVPFPDAYEKIRPFAKHVHIKDAVRTPDAAECVRVGDGQVGYRELLCRLKADGYSGFLSLETHYRKHAHLNEEQLLHPGGADFSDGGEAASAESILALKQLLQEV